MRLKGFEEDVYSQSEEGEEQLVSYGDKSRIMIMRHYLDSVFQGNVIENMTDDDGKDYVVSSVYEFAQSGTRAQVDIIGDSYTFQTTIYYSFVQNGINTRSAIFYLDGAIIPYQSMTMYRTPTMDGNVYANTTNGATKNLVSQSTFSVAFELPALKDDTTNKMLEYLLNGDLNQAHLLRVNINGTIKDYLVTLGELRLIGEIVKNLGQSVTFMEAPDDYDLISFGNYLNVYYAHNNVKISGLSLPESAQVAVFGDNGYMRTSGYILLGDYIVSTVEINNENLKVV
jgi:hypothetical protein